MDLAYHIVPILFLGVAGALGTLVVVYLLAGRWKQRSGSAYAFAALLVYSSFFVATLHHSLLNTKTLPDIAAAGYLTWLLIGQGAVTALAVSLFTIMAFGLFIAVRPRPEHPRSRFRVGLGWAVFCFLFATMINPMYIPAQPGADEHAGGLASGAVATPGEGPRETVESLRDLGVLDRIETVDETVTHYLRPPFATLADEVIAAYADAAFRHQLHVGGTVLSEIVLRDAASGQRIGVRTREGRFIREILASR